MHASYFLDATEQGDLLPLTGTEYVTGFESQKETGEEPAPEPQVKNIQAVTWCSPVEYVDGEDHIIDKPEQYDSWRDYVPSLDPPRSGKLLDLAMSHPHTLEHRPMGINPLGDTPEGHYSQFVYRKIAQPSNFTGSSGGNQVCCACSQQQKHRNSLLHD